MKRFFTTVLCAGLLAVTATACAEKDENKKALQKIIERTESLANRYLYREEIPGRVVLVRGLVEDDFRFKARLSVDNRDILDEVVSDDTLAVRFLEPSFLEGFIKSDPSSSPNALAGLQTRRWVLDAGGAPPIGSQAIDERILGIDPIVDSLSVLQYVRLAVGQSGKIDKFNNEALDYKPAEDPFPKPKEGSGIIRWDVKPPNLPRADAQDASGQADVRLAKVPHFRKLAVYVKGGRVIQVREEIGAKGKFLDSVETYVRAIAKDNSEEAEDAILAGLASVKTEEDRALFLLAAVDGALLSAGEDLVRPRTMLFELRDLGATDVKVELPTEVVPAKLGFFGVNAQRKGGINEVIGALGGANVFETDHHRAGRDNYDDNGTGFVAVRVVAVLITASVLVAACRRQGADHAVRLDGSPRLADEEGVVEAVSASRVTLSPARTYKLSDDVIAFSTYTRARIDPRTTRGQYVQVGLRDRVVVWMSRVGGVVTAPNQRRLVPYDGHLLRMDGRRMVFRDGTVLRLGDGITPPPTPTDLLAEIDPEARAVRGAHLRTKETSAP